MEASFFRPRLLYGVQEFCELPQNIQIGLVQTIWVKVHDVISNASNPVETGNEINSVDFDANFLPSLLVLQQSNVFTESEIRDSLDLSAILPPCPSLLEFRNGEFSVQHLTNTILDFAHKGRCCTALAESEIRLWWWPRYVRA